LLILLIILFFNFATIFLTRTKRSTTSRPVGLLQSPAHCFVFMISIFHSKSHASYTLASLQVALLRWHKDRNM
jgi:hypothetical protein